MKTLEFLLLKAIGGFEGKIIKYRNERVRVNRLETSTVPDVNDHGVIAVDRVTNLLIGHPDFGLIFVFVKP